MEKKRKLIYLTIGSIGISTGLLAVILMIKNYQSKKIEAEIEQAEKEEYSEDLESARGYSRASNKRFRVNGSTVFGNY